MSAVTSPAPDVGREYRECMALALRHLRRKFPGLGEDEPLEAYDEVWTRLLERKADEGFWPDDLEPWLLAAVEYYVIDELRKAEPQATESSDPLKGILAQEAGEPMDERVIGELDAENYRSIIDSLSPRQRDVAKLRFDWGLAPREIAEVLALDRARCYEELENATKTLRRKAARVRSGEHLGSFEKVLRRYLAGTASEAEHAEAVHLLATSSQAKMIAVEMARQARDLGALLPAPALAVEESRGRALEVLSTIKQQLADTTATAKQHVTSAAGRVDPTPLSGTRPGAVAALVAGCVAVGGGGTAICVDQGINPLDAIPGVKTEAQAEKPHESKAEAQPKLPLEPVKVKAPEPDPAKLEGEQDVARQLAPKVAPSAPSAPAPSSPVRRSAPAAPAPSPGEFDLQSSGTPSGEPGSAEPVQPSTPAPPAGGGGGEFGP